MKLTEIFSHLTYGELSQLSIGGSEAGVIDETNYARVISHINLGLTALYKRFPLKEGRITLGLSLGRMTYPLTTDYAVSNTKSKQLVKYIQDSTAESFTNDILKVEGVYTANDYEFGLNDLADPYAIMTPSPTVIRVPPMVVAQSSDLPEELKTATLLVTYRANHPIIVADFGWFDPETYEVELPYTHLEPLLFFVASRVNNPIGMVNEFNAGNNYAAKYEHSCQLLEALNLKVDQGSQADKLHDRGWV